MSHPQHLRIGLLHCAPGLGALAENRALIERGIEGAARHGASWVLTPELAVCGYGFAAVTGTEWILPQPDAWMMDVAARARRLGISVFLGCPERDPDTGRLHNSLFAIDRDGRMAGRHRKLHVIPGSESWSTPGQQLEPVVVDDIRVGLLVCADAYPPGPARRLAELGAQVLVSAAAWAPGEHGPAGEWEARSQETGLPVIVCNRTGTEPVMDFEGAESVLVRGGQREVEFSAPASTLVIVDWTLGGTDPDARIHCRELLAAYR